MAVEDGLPTGGITTVVDLSRLVDDLEDGERLEDEEN